METNKLYLGDCLDVMKEYLPDESIDLVYLDPPYGSERDYGAFNDKWKWSDGNLDYEELMNDPLMSCCLYALKLLLGKGANLAYLSYMANRLRELRRVLKPTGSIYLHCDPTMSHYLKIVMDGIFGRKNFKNEIVWKRTARGFKGSQFPARGYNTNTDCLLFYGTEETFFDMTRVLEPYSKEYLASTYKHKDSKGRFFRDEPFRRKGAGDRPNLCYEYKGFYSPRPTGWQMKRERLEEIDRSGDLEISGEKIYRKIRPKAGMIRNNLWDDIAESKGKERLGYPTQKPVALLKRIIEASSNSGDVVFDPFCGSGTTLVAAKSLNRNYIGIDQNPDAIKLTEQRLKRTYTQLNLTRTNLEANTESQD